MSRGGITEHGSTPNCFILFSKGKKQSDIMENIRDIDTSFIFACSIQTQVQNILSLAYCDTNTGNTFQ